MLKGEHVVLRPLRSADFDSWYRLMAEDVEVALLGSGVWFPYTVEAARKRWEGVLHADSDERMNLAVEVAGDFIGTVALKDIDHRSQHAWPSIVLDGARVGRGYGRDALHTLLRWAFEIQNFQRISLETWATNARALRCYRAVGFVEEGRMREVMWLDGAYVGVVQMGILRREWQAAR